MQECQAQICKAIVFKKVWVFYFKRYIFKEKTNYELANS